MFGRRTRGVALVPMLLLAGCSSTPESEGRGAGEDLGEIGVELPTAPALTDHKLGEAFTYQERFSDGTAPVDWQVTVTKLQCGLIVLKNAADNPAYTSGDWSSDNVPPENIDATPAPGKAFCRMDATLKNVGKTPASGAESFGDLETDKGRFAANYDEDVSISSNLLEIAKAPTGPFNPGDTAPVIKIWAAPVDAKPQAVMFPGDTVYDKSSHRISVG
jgi:hypothetical protein